MAEIELISGGKALIDDEDLPCVSQRTWRRLGNGYVATSVGKGNVTLARFVTGAGKEYSIRYRNKNKLDCRKSNLLVRLKAPPVERKGAYDEDLSGKRFGHVLVLERANQRAQWKCLCDCGVEFVTTQADLKAKRTRTGCFECRKASFIRLVDDYAEVELNERWGIWGKISLEDVERVRGYCVSCTGHKKREYAQISTMRGGGKQLQFHRWLLMDKLEGDLTVDHINGNPLDNRRENLRVCTQAQNNGNRFCRSKSGYMGVVLDTTKGNRKPLWMAKIKHRYLGKYKTPEEAAKAFDAAAREEYGKYARLNFPEDGELSAHDLPETF